jgi:lysophospholipase L1-like esterase
MKMSEEISKKIMYDGLHLTSDGYALLSEAISSFITILLNN